MSRAPQVYKAVIGALLVMAMAMGVVVADASAQPDEESAPIAVDDAQLLRGGRLTWINVLHNDLYDGPQRPTVTIVDAPSEGRAAVYGKRYPSVFYRAPWRFSGIDTFTYELCVAGECSRATVTMVVGTPACTISGTRHDDVLVGTEGDDVICGFAGSDQIDGLGGNDLIFGSQGRDVINGGPGNDVIIGGWGKDILDGGPGDDRLEGGWASDQLFGGEGQDRLIGGWGADLLDGGPGVDVAQGGRGFDECSNAESWDRCEVIPEPVETGDFEVLAPLDGTDISAEIPIVVSYEPDVGIERIEVSVDGEVVVDLPVDQFTGALSLDPDYAGLAEIEFRSIGANGPLASTTVTVNVRPEFQDFAAMVDAFENDEITVDEYLLAALPAASGQPGPSHGDLDGDLDDHEESTMVVLDMFARYYGEVQPETQDAIRLMSQVTVEPLAGAEVGALRAPGDCELYTWPLALISAREFCSYESNAPSGATDIHWLVRPVLLEDPAYTNKLDAAASKLWSAELLFESYDLELPDVHSVDGVPLTLFVTEDGFGPLSGVGVDGNLPAFSSPFLDPVRVGLSRRTVDVGHPMRLRTRHIDGNTIVHEIFHTFEWDSIDWESDVFNQFFSSRGRTIAFYESAANWGTQEYTASDPTNSGGYNSGYTREDWFADPTAPFLNYSDWSPRSFLLTGRAYSYFPGLVWLDEHAGVIPLPDPTNESGGFVVDMIKAYADDGLVAGQDPWDLLRSQVESGDLGAPGEKPLSLAWPRMWMALYLLRDTSATNADGDLLVDQYPWAVFKDSETARWRQVFDSGENPLGDSYGYGRPARKALTSVTNGFTEMPQVSVSPGGAAFYDFEMPPGSGTARFTIEHMRDNDHDRFEGFLMQFDDSTELIPCGQELLVSDPALDPTVLAFDVAYTPDCPKVTVGVTNVNLDAPFYDLAGDGADEEFRVAVNVMENPPPPTVKPVLPAALSGVPYASTVVQTIGTADYTVTIDSVVGLPPGLNIAADGAISGTAAYGSIATLEVTITDAVDQSTSGTVNLVVNGPDLDSATLADAMAGVFYSADISAFVQLGPDSAAIASYDGAGLPPGMTISTTGVISGVATGAGIYFVDVTATNVNGASTQETYRIDVAAPDVETELAAVWLPFGVQGEVYNDQSVLVNAATPRTGATVDRFELRYGSLPTGLSLSSGGSITGTAQVEGTYSFGIEMFDTAGGSDLQEYTIFVVEPAIGGGGGQGARVVSRTLVRDIDPRDGVYSVTYLFANVGNLPAPDYFLFFDTPPGLDGIREPIECVDFPCPLPSLAPGQVLAVVTLGFAIV